MIHPILRRLHFTKQRFLLTWAFFWFLALVGVICRVYIPFFSALIPVTLCITVFTSLFSCVAIYVVARNKMKRNRDQESRRNFMAFLQDLKMAKTCVLVVSLCSFCYLPTVVVFGIEHANILNNDDKTLDLRVNAFDWTDTLASMNST